MSHIPCFNKIPLNDIIFLISSLTLEQCHFIVKIELTYFSHSISYVGSGYNVLIPSLKLDQYCFIIGQNLHLCGHNFRWDPLLSSRISQIWQELAPHNFFPDSFRGSGWWGQTVLTFRWSSQIWQELALYYFQVDCFGERQSISSNFDFSRHSHQLSGIISDLAETGTKIFSSTLF